MIPFVEVRCDFLRVSFQIRETEKSSYLPGIFQDPAGLVSNSSFYFLAV
jgi:hypothetical protein